MSEIVVSDSTCLIGLERVGKLDILPALFYSVTIPLEVERKFGGKFDWVKAERQLLLLKISSMILIYE